MSTIFLSQCALTLNRNVNFSLYPNFFLFPVPLGYSIYSIQMSSLLYASSINSFFLLPTIYWVSYFIKYSTVQYNNMVGESRAGDVVAASPLGLTSERLLLLTSKVCRSSRSSICFVLLLTSGSAGVTAASDVGQTLG